MRRALLLLACGAWLAGCSPDRTPPAEAGAPVTVSAFQQLRFLQGTWRGTGPAAPPFYESYLFLDDSTIRSFTYADSTLARAADSAFVRLRDGRVRLAGGGAEWLALSFDSSGVAFAPLHDAANAVRWTPESHDAWWAELTWASGNGAPRAYHMERIGS